MSAQAESFQEAAVAAARASSRDGLSESAHATTLAADAMAVGLAARQRLLWTVSATFTALLPMEQESEDDVAAGSGGGPAALPDLGISAPRLYGDAQSSGPPQKRKDKVRRKEMRHAAAVRILNHCASSLETLDPMNPEWKQPADSVRARAALQQTCLRLSQVRVAGTII